MGHSRLLLGRFRASTNTSTSFQLRNRSTHIERESPTKLALEAAVQYEFLSKSRTEQNVFGIRTRTGSKFPIHDQPLILQIIESSELQSRELPNVQLEEIHIRSENFEN